MPWKLLPKKERVEILISLFCLWVVSVEDKYIREMLFVEEVLNREGLTTKFKGYPINRLQYIKRALEKYGELWVITAIVDGSIGYHTFTSAKTLLTNVVENTFVVCERTMACYDGDASSEIASDIFRMERLAEENPEKAKRLIEFVEKISNLPWEQASAISSLYPTLTI
jgi:hypothetical protein